MHEHFITVKILNTAVKAYFDIEGCDLLEAQMPYIFYFESTRFVFLLCVGAITT